MKHLQALQQISKVPESLLRQTKIVEYFETLDIHACVDFFLQLHTHLKSPNYDFIPLHLDFVIHDQWRKSLGIQRLKDIHSYCLTQGNFLLAGAFYSKISLSEDSPKVPEAARMALSKLTLGEKKQLSRLSDRKKIDFLLFDSDPTVIAQLLNNPRVLERDVLKMIHQSLRSSRLLAKVYQHEKWIRLPHVQKSLLCHDMLPAQVFALLIRHAAKQDLHLVRERIYKNEHKLLWVDYLLSV